MFTFNAVGMSPFSIGIVTHIHAPETLIYMDEYVMIMEMKEGTDLIYPG